MIIRTCKQNKIELTPYNNCKECKYTSCTIKVNTISQFNPSTNLCNFSISIQKKYGVTFGVLDQYNAMYTKIT